MAPRQVVIVAGSNRTGTSLLTELLIRDGFSPPAGEMVASEPYDVHESQQFKRISRHWNWEEARRFVESLEGEKIVLKYPKASFVLKRWLELIPDAKVVYVFRPQREAVESQIRNWWRPRPLEFLARWIYRYEWLRGYLAMRNLSVPVCFVTFEELKRAGRFSPPTSWGWS